MAYRKPKKRNVVWDYFQVVDKEEGVASCNQCQAVFSFGLTLKNLLQHLRKKHGFVENSREDLEESDIEGEKSISKDNVTNEKSEVWQYFEEKDGDSSLATCSMCLLDVSCTDEQFLTDHVRNIHNVDPKTQDKEGEAPEQDDDSQCDDDDDDNGDADDTDAGGDYNDESLKRLCRKFKRNRRSVAWEYFEVRDQEKKVAQCKKCGVLNSYRSSVSNLMKHIFRKHNGRSSDEWAGSAAEVNETDTARTEVKIERHLNRPFVSRTQRSIVWLYFKCIDPDNKVSQCLICNKKLSYSTTITNLKKHLNSKHPNVKIPAKEDGRKRILMSSGGQLYEVETESKNGDDIGDLIDAQADTVEMDTVFFEDFDTLPVDPVDLPKPSKKRKQTRSSSKKKEKLYSSSSEEEITFINRYVKKNSDSFDHFGKYVASLLRKLPKDTSSQLQADFVKQIMNAKPEEATDSVSQLFESEVNK